MKSTVSMEIFSMFPAYIRGVVVGKNIHNDTENQNLMELLKQAEKERQSDESSADIRNNPRIASWRQAYISLGVNPNKFACSIESLCKRVRNGVPLPYINTAVALFNYFSLKHIVPSGGDDLITLTDDLNLTFAPGNEKFIPFNSENMEYTVSGEVIYITDSVVMCRRWNWRQGNQTKLDKATRNIAVNVDCLPPVGKEEAEKITSELADLMYEFCGGQVKYFILDKQNSEGEL